MSQINNSDPFVQRVLIEAERNGTLDRLKKRHGLDIPDIVDGGDVPVLPPYNPDMGGFADATAGQILDQFHRENYGPEIGGIGNSFGNPGAASGELYGLQKLGSNLMHLGAVASTTPYLPIGWPGLLAEKINGTDVRAGTSQSVINSEYEMRLAAQAAEQSGRGRDFSIGKFIGPAAAMAIPTVLTGGLAGGAAAGAWGTTAGTLGHVLAETAGATAATWGMNSALAASEGSILNPDHPIENALQGTPVGVLESGYRWAKGEATFDDKLNFTVGGLMELIGTFAGPAMHLSKGRPAPIFGPPEPPGGIPYKSSWNAKRAGGVNNGDVGGFVDFMDSLNGAKSRDGWTVNTADGTSWGDVDGGRDFKVDITNDKTGQKVSVLYTADTQDIHVTDGKKMWKAARDADGRMVFVDMSEAYKNATRGEVDAALAPAVRSADQELLPGSSRLNPDPTAESPYSGPPRRLTAGPIDNTPLLEPGQPPAPNPRWALRMPPAPTNDGRPPIELPGRQGPVSSLPPQEMPTGLRTADELRDTVQRNKPFAFITDTLDADQLDTPRTARLRPGETYQDALRRELSDTFGPQNVIPTTGTWEGTPQGVTFMVLGAKPETIRPFLEPYGQKAAATHEGMVYQDGSINPRVPQNDAFGPEARQQPFFSTLHSTDGPIDMSLGYDFEQKIKPGELPPTQPKVYLADHGNPAGGHVELPGVYLRAGLPPEGPSTNHFTGTKERGVSVYKAYKDPNTGKYILEGGGEQYLNTQGSMDRPWYEVTGRDVIDVGADGEDLLHPDTVKVVRQVHPDEIVTEGAPHLTISGKELLPQEEPTYPNYENARAAASKAMTTMQPQDHAAAANAIGDAMFPGKKQGPFRKAVKGTVGQMMFEFGQNVANLGMKGLAFGLGAAEILHAVGYDLGGLLHTLGHVGDVNHAAIGFGALMFSRLKPKVATAATANFVATEAFRSMWEAGLVKGKKTLGELGKVYDAALEAAHVKAEALFRETDIHPLADHMAANRTDINEVARQINDRRMKVYNRFGAPDPKTMTVDQVHEILGTGGTKFVPKADGDSIREDQAYHAEAIQRILDIGSIDPAQRKAWAEWYSKDMDIFRNVAKIILPDLARGEDIDVKFKSGHKATMKGNEFLMNLVLAITSPSNKVTPNLGMTINIMSHFLADGYFSPVKRGGARIPKPYGDLASGAEALGVLDVHPWHKNPSVSMALDKLNYLLERTGGNMQEVADFLTADTNKGFEHLIGNDRIGQSISKFWRKDGTVSPGKGDDNFGILGPKAGDFAGNMAGDSSKVTVDVHETRGGTRRLQTPFVAGTNELAAAPTELQRVLLSASIADAGKVFGLDPMSSQAASWGIEKAIYAKMLPGYDGEMYGFGRAALAYAAKALEGMDRVRARAELKKVGLAGEDISMVKGMTQINPNPGRNIGERPGQVVDDPTAAARWAIAKRGDAASMVGEGGKSEGAIAITDRHIELWKAMYGIDESHPSVIMLRKAQAGIAPTGDYMRVYTMDKKTGTARSVTLDPFTHYENIPLFGNAHEMPGVKLYANPIGPLIDAAGQAIRAAIPVATNLVRMAFQERTGMFARTGPIGRWGRDTANAANDTYLRIVAKFDPDIRSIQKRLQSLTPAGIKEANQALRELNQMNPVTDPVTGAVIAYTSKFQEAVENRNGSANHGLSPLARDIVLTHRKITRQTGLMAERLGVTRMTPAGPVKFTASPDGKVFIRSLTEYGQSLMDLGDKHPDFNNLITALSVLNNRPVDAVRHMMHQYLQLPVMNRAAFEFFREFPEFPSHLRQSSGGVAPLLDTNASTATQSMLSRQAKRLSFIGNPETGQIHFGQELIPLERFRDDWLREAVAHGVQPGAAVAEVDALLRGTAGLSMHPGLNAFFERLAGHTLGLTSLMNAVFVRAGSALMMTGSAPLQLQHTTKLLGMHQAGPVEILHALWREIASGNLVVAKFLDRYGTATQEKMDLLARGGLHSPMPIKWRMTEQLPTDAPITQKAMVAGTHLANIISEAAYRGFLVEFTSNLGANIAARATNAMNIKRAASAVGKPFLTPHEQAMMYIVGYDKAVLQRLGSANWTPDDLVRILAETQQANVGHGGSATQNTILNSHPIGKEFSRFSSWFTNIGREQYRAIQQVLQPAASGRNVGRTNAFAAMARTQATLLAAGVGALLTTAILTGGLSAVQAEWEKATGSWEGAAHEAVKLFQHSLGGGIVGSLLKSSGVDTHGVSAPENPWDYITFWSTSARTADNIYNAAAGKGRYDNLSFWQTIGAAMRTTIPGIQRVEAMVALAGLTNRDLGVENARKEVNKWYYNQPELISQRGVTFDVPGTDIYMREMKQMYISVEQGDANGAKAHFKAALEQANLDAAAGKRRNLKNSFEDHLLLPRMGRYPGMLERAKAALGPEIMSKAAAHDEMVMKFLSGLGSDDDAGRE